MRDGSVLAFFTFWLLWEGLQPRALWIEAEAAPANSGKGGNAPDADAAEPVRCPCGGDAILGSAIHRGSDSCRPARVEGGGPAIPPLRVRYRCDALQRFGTRTGRFLVWACARIARFTVWFGAGIEPATVGLTVRCSTRLSYPCETYRIRTGDLQSCLLLYQAELTSLRGTPSPDPRHTPRQCRAHRTGMQARTAVERSSMFRIGASDTTSKAPIRVRSHPLSARAEASRHGASLRLRGVSLPRASNARMLRERDAIALDRVIPLCERQNENAPRVLEPEGVRVASGDRGDRSPRCERSVDVGGAEIIPLAAKLQCIAPFARAQARIALGRWQQCSDVEDGGHGNSMVRNVVRKFRRGRRWRTLRALFSFGNKIFTSPTSGGIPAVVRPETGVRVDFRWSIVLIARRSFESRL